MGVWLVDLAHAVRPLSEAYYVTFIKRANKPEKSNSVEYVKVAMELREALSSLLKKTSTTRGSAFNAEFAEEPSDDTGRPRKRAGTTSISVEESFSKKAKNPKCPACGIRGHVLLDCWIIFEDKRPEGFKPTDLLVKKVKDKLAKDNNLAAEVEKIRRKEQQDADDEA